MAKKQRQQLPDGSDRFRIYLREWREHRGVRPDDPTLLSLVGVASHDAIRRYENGFTAYNRQTLDGYAVRLGCSPADLLAGPPPISLEEVTRSVWRFRS